MKTFEQCYRLGTELHNNLLVNGRAFERTKLKLFYLYAYVWEYAYETLLTWVFKHICQFPAVRLSHQGNE